jgi:hypothetical protein
VSGGMFARVWSRRAWDSRIVADMALALLVRRRRPGLPVYGGLATTENRVTSPLRPVSRVFPDIRRRAGHNDYSKSHLHILWHTKSRLSLLGE